MEAAQTADYLLHVLFALQSQWRPYNSRLIFHLDQLKQQGWKVEELREILLDLIITGNPGRQQIIARKVTTLLCDRGFGHVYDDWEGQIDQVLSWEFSSDSAITS